jgi:hypothetical protein
MTKMLDEPRRLIDPAEIGRKGGLSRAKRLSPKQRSDSAKKAAAARWGKKKRKSTKGRIA